MTRVADLRLLPVAPWTVPVVLFASETVQAALVRIRHRAEDEFPVFDHGVLVGMVRRGDLLAFAASDRVSRALE